MTNGEWSVERKVDFQSQHQKVNMRRKFYQNWNFFFIFHPFCDFLKDTRVELVHIQLTHTNVYFQNISAT